MGSLLGFSLITQIVTGIYLARYYCSDSSVAFFRVVCFTRDEKWGWLIRAFHRNGASIFFICIYLHMARGIYYGSYIYYKVWLVGCVIILLSIITAFLGYVLPWGQISFWGGTVITRLLNVIPYSGRAIVITIWGDFAVRNITLTRFFSLHYFLPFIIARFSVLHLIFLHQKGSRNPLGTFSNVDKVKFYPYFFWKDLVGLRIYLSVFLFVSFFYPWILRDPENFISANPSVSPLHIQPEWYFLFAYTILRSVPNKPGGVVALLASVLVFFFLPFTAHPDSKIKGNNFSPITKGSLILFIVFTFGLTYLGTCPAEGVFILSSVFYSKIYFLSFILYWVWSWAWIDEF